MMKVFIAVLALCMGVAVVLPAAVDETSDTIPPLGERLKEEAVQQEICLAETGADTDALMKVKATLKWETIDEKGKCFTACIMKKRNMTDDQGHLVISNIRKALIYEGTFKQDREKIINKCGALNVNGQCETAFAYFKCTTELEFLKEKLRLEYYSMYTFNKKNKNKNTQPEDILSEAKEPRI